MMRLSQAVGILSRRLGIRQSRVKNIASRLQDAGYIHKVEGSRRFPTDISDQEFVALCIAVIAEAGIGTAATTAHSFGELTDDAGCRLDHKLTQLLYGPPRNIQHIIARHAPLGISIIVDGHHQVFGNDPAEYAAQPARIIPGSTLTAIGAEAQGASPEHADAMAVISKLRG